MLTNRFNYHYSLIKQENVFDVFKKYEYLSNVLSLRMTILYTSLKEFFSK